MARDTSADHAGHRERLRKRFLRAGGDALADYELLELLLFMALPRRDAKPLAKRLIKRFGAFSDVIGASVKQLREVDGAGDAALLNLLAMLKGRGTLIMVTQRPAMLRLADRIL